MTEPTLSFLPWVDRGGTTDRPPDRRETHPANQVSTSAEVRVNNDPRPASIPVLLMGPGDVTSLVPQQIIRTDPAAGTRAFESNYLALVEFDEPALPWLFTPASALDGRLRPWLCLVVVALGPGVRLEPPGATPLPVLRIGPPARPEIELPDLTDSWAWAHAQVAATGSGGPGLTEALGGDPARNLSRLLCGRLLAEQTDYVACVVPTFEAGRRAGLGEDPAGAAGPAWTLAPDMGPVRLPVYHHWHFATGPAGDFQSLALAIRGRPVPDTFGSRPIDLSTAGLGLGGTDDAQLRLGGALRALDADPVAWSDPSLPARFATALTEVLNTPDQAPAEAPVLAPPRYGAAYRPVATLDPTVPARWYEQLNTDPAARVAAALGVQVVQRDQEALVASAWDQAADLRAVSALGRLAGVGIAVAERMQARHLTPLGREVGVFVVGPLLPRLRLDPVVSAPALARVLAGDGVHATTFSATVRRVVRTRGATVRRAQRSAIATPASSGAGEPARLDLAVRIDRIAGPARARLDVGNLATLEVLGSAAASPIDLAWRLMAPDAFSDAPLRPRFTVRPLSLGGVGGGFRPVDVLDVVRDRTTRASRIPPALARRRDDDGLPDIPEPPEPREPPEEPGRPPRPDSPDAAAFRELAPRHLTRFLNADHNARPVPTPIDMPALFDQVLALTAPATAFTAALGRLLAGPTPTLPNRPTPSAPLPASLSPRFGAPMAGSLAELGQEWLLPGLGEVPANTALALRTNASFVHAFMIGLNHELGRELLWREFPTPLTATFFQRFFDNAVDPTAPVDLDPLAEWGDRPLGAASTTDERFVLLLRTELLRRFPEALVTAVRGSETILPLFTGALVPDVRYFGFAIPATEAAQWSIVIAEQPGAPRFGFEVGHAPAGVSHAPAIDATSAALAQRLIQLPALITIPVPVLLRPDDPQVNR
ncbi:MAG TPA: hypothetical protein VF143_00435 [Candidatus Nanopelagicales bacterium]